MAAPWKDPWLVQRLEPPHGSGSTPVTPFTFGGGMKDGGLKPEALSALGPLFTFEYMGAAEYEFGGVPKAFQKLVAHAQADALTMDIIEVSGTEIYLLCHADHHPQVCDFVTALAEANVHKRAKIRDWSNLDRIVHPDPRSRYQPTTCGWLELDNGFMFFTDKPMWEGTAALFIGPNPEIEENN